MAYFHAWMSLKLIAWANWHFNRVPRDGLYYTARELRGLVHGPASNDVGGSPVQKIAPAKATPNS